MCYEQVNKIHFQAIGIRNRETTQLAYALDFGKENKTRLMIKHANKICFPLTILLSLSLSACMVVTVGKKTAFCNVMQTQENL